MRRCIADLSSAERGPQLSAERSHDVVVGQRLRELASRQDGRDRELLLHAAATLEREANPWQPIETAPKDPDQQVLLYVPPRVSVRDDYDLPAYQVVAVWDGAYWVAAYDEIDRVNGPTHWMPLRDPPTQ